jgi:NAD(P)H-hydrate epimerase
MKIPTAQQIRAWDAYTIANEPIASIELMERASKAFVQTFMQYYGKDRRVKIFCGPGNNGGDGLAIARLMLNEGYKIDAFIIKCDRYSPDCITNHKRLLPLAPDNVFYLTHVSQLLPFADEDIIIDALYGTGLSRPIDGLAKDIIGKINASDAKVVAVDIPSGLYVDKQNGANDTIVKADRTFTFQAPKFSFFFCSNAPFTGRWEVLDIGLSKEFYDTISSNYHWIDHNTAAGILKPRQRCDHKGTFGHALIWAGGYGKMGAAQLCSKAALKAGAGLVTAYIPKCGYVPFQTALPEVMVMTDEEEELLSAFPATNKYSAIGLGPGIGQEKVTQKALHDFLKSKRDSVVLDADALNILSENKDWLKLLPANAILTPHPKEFERLAGASEDEWIRLEKATDFAKAHRCILVLKTAYTSIHLPDGSIYFNATGNPGMAKGGSGDVLTGIITGILAQKYEPHEAAILGVYLHGLAGDIASVAHSEWSVLASDIIDGLGTAFLQLTINS